MFGECPVIRDWYWGLASLGDYFCSVDRLHPVEDWRESLLQVVDLPTVEKSTADRIKEKCDSIRDLLLEKNKSYGDSAINPQNIFSRHGAEVLICSRIDDKLNRIKNQQEDAFGEDVVQDLIGYLVLLLVVRDKGKGAKDEGNA